MENTGPRVGQEDRLRLLLEVGRGLVTNFDLETVLARVLEAARELTGAQYAALGVLDRDGHALERFITSGIATATQQAIGHQPRGRGVLGVLISDPRPVRLADVGAHPQSYGFPPDHPPMHSFLGVPIRVRDRVYGNLYLTEKQGGEFDTDDEEALIVLADWAAIAIENARTYTRMAGRHDELEQAVASFEATSEIAHALAGETDLEHVLELIAKRARALTEARAMVVLLQAGNQLAIVALAGELDRALIGERVPIDGSVSGQVFLSGRPERLADAPSRLRFALAEQTKAKTGLFVPLRLRGRVLGVLSGFDRLRDGPQFSARDEQLLSAFAASAAAAVATAQDVQTQSRQRSIAAAEQERTRWARELHDETLQELAALKLLLASARVAGERERDRHLELAGERIALAVRGLRDLITELRPASLDELGLEPALQMLCDRARRGSNLDLSLDVELAYEAGREETRLAPEIEDAVYRLIQEALSNVAKHAATDRVEVVVRETARAVEASITDNGKGFDPQQDSAGFGLLGMRERAALLGGTISIESHVGEGTIVRIVLPARRAGEHDLRESLPA